MGVLSVFHVSDGEDRLRFRVCVPQGSVAWGSVARGSVVQGSVLQGSGPTGLCEPPLHHKQPNSLLHLVILKELFLRMMRSSYYCHRGLTLHLFGVELLDREVCVCVCDILWNKIHISSALWASQGIV